MADGKKSAVVYCDLITTVEKMKDIDAGKLFKHFLRYVNDLNPVAPNQIVEIVFEPIKQQLKRDLKKWESKSIKNTEIANERWNKIRKDANAQNGKKNDAKNTVNDTVNDNVTVTVTDTLKKENLIEIFFSDLINSSDFEAIARNSHVDTNYLKIKIPAFRKKAELSYPTFQRFVSHFKNFINAELEKEKNGTKNGNTVSKNASRSGLVELARKVFEDGDGNNA